jgi:hypothetical protein
VLDQELFIRRLLDCACDALAVLRSKDERAENQQIQCALQQFQSFPCFLGRHITHVAMIPGKMST